MLMGTLVWVSAVASEEEHAHKAVAAGLDEIRRLEQLLSTWILTSELSQVNVAAGRSPVGVGLETMEVLERSMEIARLTEGKFNIAIGPAVAAWNISKQGRIPSEKELENLRPLTDLSHIHLGKDTVFLALSGMEIDIGGIGKGYAADLAVTVMQEVGASAGVVAISGDIKTFGRMPDGQQFRFGIQHPRKEQGELVARLELENEAVSTAGDYYRYFMKNGIRFHHILDPTTLEPAHLSQSVTIVASEGWMADGLDTGVFVMGPSKGMALLESLHGVEGIIVGGDGKLFVSSGLKSRLELALD